MNVLRKGLLNRQKMEHQGGIAKSPRCLWELPSEFQMVVMMRWENPRGTARHGGQQVKHGNRTWITGELKLKGSQMRKVNQGLVHDAVAARQNLGRST